LLIQREDIAAADGLALAGVDDRGARDQCRAECRPKIVDLELGRDHGLPQHRPTRKGEGVVSEITERRAVSETVLLHVLRPQRQADLRRACAKRLELGAEQAAEGLARQHLPAHGEEIGHGGFRSKRRARNDTLLRPRRMQRNARGAAPSGARGPS
jgi:hypothetical protein